MYDDSIGLTHGFFFVPVTILADTYVISLSGVLEQKLGTRLLSLIGIAFGLYCHLIIMFVHNFWLLLLSFILYGFGIGMSYYPILKTCWKYFPEKKGVITGVILCVFGFSPLVFTSLADFVINPDGDEADEKGIFEPKVAERIKKYSLIMSIVIGTLGVLAMILMFPADHIVGDTKLIEEEQLNKEKEKGQINQIGKEGLDDEPAAPIEKEENKEEELQINEKGQQVELHESDKDKPLKQAALSCRFLLFNLMSVGTLCK